MYGSYRPRRRWLRWILVYAGGVLAVAVVGLVIEAAVSPGSGQPQASGSAVPALAGDERPGQPGAQARCERQPAASGPLQVVQGRELVNGVYLGFPHSTAGAVSAADYVVSEVFSTLDPDRAAAVMRLTAAPSYADAPQQAAQGAASDRQDLGIAASGPVPAGYSLVLQTGNTGRRREMRRRGIIRDGCLFAAVLLILLRLTGNFLVDLLWFSAVGYLDVFWTIFGTKAILFFVVFVGSTAFLWVNGTLAFRFARHRGPWLPVTFDRRSATVLTLQATLPDLLASVRLPWRLLIAVVAIVLGILMAAGEIENWDAVLRFIHQVPYGQRDPLFGKDIGFYLFSLPAYIALKDWMLLTLVLSTFVAGAVYWAHGDIILDGRRQWMSSAAAAHGSVLLGLFFAVMAWSFALDRFLLLYGDNGVVVGAGYTDIYVGLPLLWALVGLASAAALASWANLRARTYKLPLAAAVLVIGSWFLLTVAFPAVFRRVYVKPNELQLEAPYIQRNIALTQEAYNLHKISVKAFPAEEGLTAQSLQANRATIDNIRLWDWQPLMDTYAQLQEIRTYYKFHDVDVDRYELDGSYQQVMLSARELESALLPPNAQTWVNLHVLFTHGNGVVMSPVTRKSAEGLPIFYLQDIPPVATGGPAVREPRIYFGQGADSYVIVKASTPEFDYPKGKDNVYAAYDGTAGVAVGGIARRTLFAWYFDDPNILLSRYITSESRIVFRRNIQDLVRTIAPVAAPRPGPVHGDQQRAALLDAGCLHHEQLVPLRPARG